MGSIDQELTTRQRRYLKVRGISRGGFGTHDLCYDRIMDERAVLKFIPRGERVTERLERQITNHFSMKHPHITNVSEVFLLPSYLVVVMEYVENGTLEEYLQKRKRLTEEEARWFFQQIMIAVDYLHSLGVAHRDLKLEHILLSCGDMQKPLTKLTSFGLSKHERLHSKPKSFVGTIQYMAPEVIASQSAGEVYCGKSVDMWTIGVLLFKLIAGDFPYTMTGMNISQIAKVLTESSFKLPGDVQASPELVNLLERLLNPNVEERISAREVLQHPWFVPGVPKGIAEWNDNLKDTLREKDQTVDEVRTIIEEARKTQKLPDHSWDDSEYMSEDEHQSQLMDTEEAMVFMDEEPEFYNEATEKLRCLQVEAAA